MSLEVTLIAHISIIHTNPLDLTTPVDKHTQQYQIDFTNGTGSGEADLVWHDQRTLAASTTEDLDVEGGLTSAFGVVINPARIKAILVAAASGNTNDVILFGDANGIFSGLLGADSNTIAVKPGGFFAWGAPATGCTTVAGTEDILQVANGGAGTSVTYDMWLVMASA